MDNQTSSAKEFADKVIKLMKEHNMKEIVFLVRSQGHLIPGLFTINADPHPEMVALLEVILSICRSENPTDVKFHTRSDNSEWKTQADPKSN